jgi:hypothetical protein
VPEVSPSLRTGDAPGSSRGGLAREEGISTEDVPRKGAQASPVSMRAYSVRRVRSLVLGLLVSGCVTVTESPSRAVKIGDLVSDPAAFDGKLVTVTGRVSAVEFRNGSRGKPLRRVFTLNDESRVVRVVSTAGPTCGEGSVATVNGRFSERNGLVEATWVVCQAAYRPGGERSAGVTDEPAGPQRTGAEPT